MRRCRRRRSRPPTDEGARPSRRPRRPPRDRRPAMGADAPTSSPRSTTLGKEGVWHVGGARELKLTNLDKVLFEPPPADPAASPSRSASSSATSPGSRRRCCRTSPSGRSTSSASRTAPAARASGRRTSPTTAPTWLRRWHEAGVDGRGPRGQRPPHRRSGRDAVLARQPGGVRDPRLDRHACADPWRPTFALIDIDPGDEDDLGRDARPRPALPDGARAPRRPRLSRRRPASAASRSGSRSSRSTTFDDTSDWVERVSRAVGVDGARTSSPGSGRRRPRKGKARLDYTQNATIKTLVAPYAVRPAAGRAGLGADRLGRARRPGPAPRSLDDPDDRRARGRGRRPVRGRPDRRAGAAAGLSAARPRLRRDARVAGFADA